MFEFTEEYEPLLRGVREVAEKVVKPRAKEIEESDEFPVDMANRFFKEGYLQVLIPKHLGGMGKDITSFCILSEEIARGLGIPGPPGDCPERGNPSPPPGRE